MTTPTHGTVQAIEQPALLNTPTTPTIHRNGTGREALLDQATNTADALRNALDLLYAMSPHGRDYYPQGDDALRSAEREHSERIASVQRVLDDVSAYAERVASAPRR